MKRSKRIVTVHLTFLVAGALLICESFKGGKNMGMFKKIKKIQLSYARLDARPDERTVEFSFYAPRAGKVFLAGAFNAWNARSLPMKKDASGLWKITINLPPGHHEYKYIVDGVWIMEPSCSDKVPNPYGTYNSVIGVQ